jgi:iron complex transport system ATP-binding protein
MNRPFCQITNLIIGFETSKPANQKPMSFVLDKAKIIGLVGPNGSGKTCLLRTLMGDLPPLAGTITFLDHPKPTHQWTATEVARMFSYLPQESVFERGQSVESHVRLGLLPELGFFGKPNQEQKERIGTLMTYFGLGAFRGKRLDDLSTGERQRTFLTRVMIQNTNCLLLDEPTNHLDKESRVKMWDWVTQLKEKNKLIFIASHELEEVERHCDEIISIS